MRDDERPASAASKGDAAPIPVVDERVAIWNTATLKKVAGQAAPMKRNLQVFLRKHPECEVYCGQDAGRPGTGGADGGVLRRVEAAANAPPTASSAARPRRVALWHKLQKRKVVGNAAPLEKNVASCEPAPRRVQLARWPAGRAGRSAAAGRI